MAPQPAAADLEASSDQGPGCLPAILAATALMGIVGFVTCGFSTWFLFQHRGEFAVRTLRTSVIPQIEQGRLAPETKVAVIEQLDQFASDVERGKYDNAAVAAVMSNLVKLPLSGWGDLQAIEALLVSRDDGPDRDEALKQFSRLKRALELRKANAIDFDSVLEPARVADDSSPTGRRLKEPLADEEIAEVSNRARLVADRAQVPDQAFDGIRLQVLIQREIETALGPQP